MVSIVTRGYTLKAIADGRLYPLLLPDVTEGETIRVALKLKAALGSDTVSGTYTFTDEPYGLTFANEARADTNTTVETDISGFIQGETYVIQLSATLTAGAVRNYRFQVRCKWDNEA